MFSKHFPIAFFIHSYLQVVGTSRPVCLTDKANLHYVQATLLELQRISNTCKYIISKTVFEVEC